MPISNAAIYAGTTDSVFRAGFVGNGFPNDGGFAFLSDLDAPLAATVQNGSLQFAGSSITLDSSTVTQTRSYLDPNTLQNKSINISFTFNPLVINFAGTPAMALTSISNGLGWSYDGNATGTYSLTGSYQLTGPTQTQTGNFSLSLQSLSLDASGQLQTAGSNQIHLSGIFGYSASLSGVVFDQTVDGIHLSVSAAGNANLDILPPSGTTLTSVPETSAITVTGLSGIALLLRRRRR